jgi:hypothetical protein
MPDTEIRTVTLPFASARTARQFVDFAEGFGYKPATKRKGSFHFVTVTFQNRGYRSRLLKAWERRFESPRQKTKRIFKKKKTRKEGQMPDTGTDEPKPEPTPEPPPPPNGG